MIYYQNKYDAQVNGLNYAKKILTDKTIGTKSQPKALVVERAFILHNVSCSFATLSFYFSI